MKRPASGPNEVWGMDFVHDQLADGRKLRTLTVLDLFTRECLAIEVGFSLRAEHVVTTMRYLSHERGRPQRISCGRCSVSLFGAATSRLTPSPASGY
jgi:putative transposase